MADPRNSRSRPESNSGRKSSRPSRSYQNTKKSSNAGLMISLGVGVVVIVGVIVVMNSGGGTSTTPANAGQAAPKSVHAPRASSQPATPAASSTGFGVAKPGKTPDRPAPAFDKAALDAAEAEYRKAVECWNESQAARKAGNTAEFSKLVNQSWRHCEQVLDLVRPQLDWLDEASLEGWAIPAGYDQLQLRRGKWLETRTYVKRSKPMERG